MLKYVVHVVVTVLQRVKAIISLQDYNMYEETEKDVHRIDEDRSENLIFRSLLVFLLFRAINYSVHFLSGMSPPFYLDGLSRASRKYDINICCYMTDFHVYRYLFLQLKILKFNFFYSYHPVTMPDHSSTPLV
jgi:hypothetical protein